jgi:hypothetical protein
MSTDPKFTVEQIKAELAGLQTSGFLCAVYYLKLELKRRERATGRRATHDTPTHQAWRRASKKYREKEARRIAQEIDDAVPEEDIRDIEFG